MSKDKTGGTAWRVLKAGPVEDTGVEYTLWATSEEQVFLRCETRGEHRSRGSLRLEVRDREAPETSPPVFATSLRFEEKENECLWRTHIQLLPPGVGHRLTLTVVDADPLPGGGTHDGGV